MWIPLWVVLIIDEGGKEISSSAEKQHAAQDHAKQHAPRRPVSLDAKIGAKLRAFRLQTGLTQQELATKCGLSFQQVQKYETGANRIPASRLFPLARALHVRPLDLLQIDLSDISPPVEPDLHARLQAASAKLDREVLLSLVTLAENLADRPSR